MYKPKRLTRITDTQYKIIAQSKEYNIDIDKDRPSSIPFEDDITKFIMTGDNLVPVCPNCGKSIDRHVVEYSEHIRHYHCKYCNKYFIRETGKEPRELTFDDWRYSFDRVYNYLIRLIDRRNYEYVMQWHTPKEGDTNE